MENISIKATKLRKSFEEIIYYFQTVQASASDPGEALSVQETKAVGFLGSRKDCIMREIADYLRVAVSTVTGLVDKLEAKGLVMRVRSDKDRRIINIVLTENGEDIYKFHIAEFEKLCLSMLKGMNAKEQNTYIELSAKIARNAAANFKRNERAAT